jgi:Spy/CpxP family protein refolding chaperone
MAPRPTLPPPPPPEGGQASLHLGGLATLMAREDVKGELGLTPEQRQAIAALDERFADRGSERLRSATYVDGVLGTLDPAQQEKLTRIEVRMMGTGALVDPAVRDRLALTQEQRDRIVALVEAQIGEIVRVGRQGVTPADRQASQLEVARLLAQLGASLGAVLTPEQRTALEAYGRGA